MWFRVALSTGVVASLPLAVSTVYAAAEDSTKTTNTTDVARLKPSQFRIYGEPTVNIMYEDEVISNWRIKLSEIRQHVWADMRSMEKGYNAVADKYRTCKKFAFDLQKHLREDAGALPRAAFITIAGLGGIVGGYKGGVIRKAFYANTAMAAAASIAYPHQAVDIASSGWSRARQEAVKVWQENKPTSGGSKVAEKGQTEKADDAAGAAAKEDQKPTVDKTDKSKLEDHGMSKPEDKDLYTTRGS